MPDVSDREFLRSLPLTVFNADQNGVSRQQLARLQRAGLIRVKLDETPGAGQLATAKVTITEAGRVAAGFVVAGTTAS